MKLELLGTDHRYAAEQMALALLPAQEAGAAQGKITLSPDKTAAFAEFSLPSGRFQGEITAQEARQGAADDQEALEKRMVKLAVYRALRPAVGDRPWGALSGVRPAKLPRKLMAQGLTPQEALTLLTGLYDLAPEKAQLTMTCAQAALDAQARFAPRDISLYLGVPFCPTRCAYCSFISADVAGSAKLVEPYVDALCREILWAGELVSRRGLRVRTVYMGGGTPTTLSAPQLERVLTALDSWLDREALLEFTVEAGRPDTITAEKLAVLQNHRVDRISVNPQTLEPHVLTAMGRAHTPEDFFRAYRMAAPLGFAINTDLIAGLPADRPDGFRRSLDGVLALEPDEITVHTLALKHGSALLNSPEELPGEEAAAQMLAYAHAALPDHGYRPYYLYRQKYMAGALENVGWTRRKAGSLYNIVMMEELHSVLSLGAGGVTKVVDPKTGYIFRRANPKYAREYLERLADTMKEREEILWPIN